MKSLTFGDVAGIALSWTGAAAIAYIAKDGFVAFFCVCAAYYLAKFIILKKDA